MPATDKKPETAAQKSLRLRNIIADTAVDIFFESREANTVDDLLCRPSVALRYARRVIARLHGAHIKATEYEVCRALMNSRKRGDLVRDKA